MLPNDWTEATIEQNRYFNREGPITGYERVGGQGDKPLHPARVFDFEDRLRETHRRFRETHPGVIAARYHVKMPYWGPENEDQTLPHHYAFVEAPQRLTTTSVTVVMVPNHIRKSAGESHGVNDASMGFYFDGDELPSLRERLERERRAGIHFEGLAGNLGYYMTETLVAKGRIPWSHNHRYPEEFHLSPIKSYIGFHLFEDAVSGAVHGSFQGAHPAAVGLRRDGRVEIIPRLQIAGYEVTLWGQTFDVDAIDVPEPRGRDVVLFTPGLSTPEVQEHRPDWATYAPLIPVDDDRVNVFIANEGNGAVPVERVVKVWLSRAPLPSVGAVLSFERGYFERCFGNADTFAHRDGGLQIRPYGDTDFDRYAQMMGGLVPLVVDGEHVYCVETVDEVVEHLSHHGNATSPIAESGRETRNFDPHIREPAGVLVQTADRIGWVLFDGRHELSIGASVVDVAVILKALQDMGALGGEVRNGVFIDGGSAMKAYAIKCDDTRITLDLLNRVAAGSRNGPGADPDGLNLYTLLRLGLASRERDSSAPLDQNDG
jgi:hypothetical protein